MLTNKNLLMLEMAAKFLISSSFTHKASDSTTSSSSSYSSLLALPQFLCTRSSSGFMPFKLHAKLGGGDGEVKPKEKKKFITKEEEPEQYWQSAGEREGENPMKTPLPYIIIFGMSTPFVILAIAFANGWIKVPIR
ncbi:Transmembrane protein [Hirschfeldia incana]|nr:Transmembrane protein [Hirschfeldia incana]